VPPAWASGDFDPTAVKQVTIDIESGAQGPWTDPTVVYVDSVRTLNGAVYHTFDTDYGDRVSSTWETVEGSTLTWVDALPPAGHGGAGGAGAGGEGAGGADAGGTSGAPP
jgi:hypothetical protein